MENGFSSPRNDAFPAGLRVLVVDDDPTWIKILEKMLIKCSYEVTTCCLARNALEILRERKYGFDIVISDVNMPDMDGFKLLEHVGLEMDLPVIMMSVDGETSRVMKGVQHGACDYLLKPVRMKELRNIWQHVLRKKIHEVKDIESFEGSEVTHVMSNGFDEFDSSHLIIGGDFSSVRKRKDMECQELDEQDFDDPSTAKKARVVWSVDLHQKFVKAVNQIGFDSGPKKILDLMNVPWLTRENVASHLQKYRLYLGRLQKENEPKVSYGAIKQQEFTLKDPTTSFGYQSSTSIYQSTAASCRFGFSGNETLIQDICANGHEGDRNDIGSFLPITKTEKAFIDHAAGHSSGSLAQDMNYTKFGSTIPQPQVSWGSEIPTMQSIEEPAGEHGPYEYSYLPLPASRPQIQVDQLQSSPFIDPGTSITERDEVFPSDIKPLSFEYKCIHARNVTTATCTTDQACGAMFTRSPSMISPSFDQISISNLELQQPSFILGSGLNWTSSHEELQVCSPQDGCIETAGINSREILNYAEPITELPSQFYEGLRFSSDYLTDNTLDYPIMDQVLFI